MLAIHENSNRLYIYSRALLSRCLWGPETRSAAEMDCCLISPYFQTALHLYSIIAHIVSVVSVMFQGLMMQPYKFCEF